VTLLSNGVFPNLKKLFQKLLGTFQKNKLQKNFNNTQEVIEKKKKLVKGTCDIKKKNFGD